MLPIHIGISNSQEQGERETPGAQGGLGIGAVSWLEERLKVVKWHIPTRDSAHPQASLHLVHGDPLALPPTDSEEPAPSQASVPLSPP